MLAMCQIKDDIHYFMLFFQQHIEAALNLIYMGENGGSESLDNLPSKYMVKLRFKADWLGPTRIKLHPPSHSWQLLGESEQLKSIHNRKILKKCNVVIYKYLKSLGEQSVTKKQYF